MTVFFNEKPTNLWCISFQSSPAVSWTKNKARHQFQIILPHCLSSTLLHPSYPWDFVGGSPSLCKGNHRRRHNWTHHDRGSPTHLWPESVEFVMVVVMMMTVVQEAERLESILFGQGNGGTRKIMTSCMKQFTRVISLPHVQANWMTEDAELQQLSILAISIHPFGSFSSVFWQVDLSPICNQIGCSSCVFVGFCYPL